MPKPMSEKRLTEIERGPDSDDNDEMDMLEIQNRAADELCAEVRRCWWEIEQLSVAYLGQCDSGDEDA